MLVINKNQRGFSLIELIIGLTIMVILSSIAIPSFLSWIRNTQIKTASDTILSGLQLARAEAVRRNTSVRFDISTGAGWSVCTSSLSVACIVSIQSKSASEGSTNVSVTSTPSQTGIAFNGLGRQITTINNDGSSTANPPVNITLDVTYPSAGTCQSAGGTVRCMRLIVSNGGQIRMCDPSLPSSNPRGC